LTEYTNKAEQEAASIIAAQSSNMQSSQVQSTQAAGQIATNDQKESQNPTNEPQIDPWDLLSPVDVMSKFPNNLDEQLGSKKWQNRKEALEAVNGILNENPKLADNADYAGLIETFTKVIFKKFWDR
jgi:protein STU2